MIFFFFILHEKVRTFTYLILKLNVSGCKNLLTLMLQIKNEILFLIKPYEKNLFG